MNNLKEKIAEPLTNTDLENYLGKNVQDHIVKYSELASYNNIKELLPHNKSYKILLIETKLNSGHWVCITRLNDVIEVFNSYGCKPSRDDFCYVPKLTNLLLGQTEPFLNNLLNDAVKDKEFKVVYNKVKFQKSSRSINTCGRWCVLRIIMMVEHDMDLQTFIAFVNTSVKKTKLSTDELVTYIIS